MGKVCRADRAVLEELWYCLAGLVKYYSCKSIKRTVLDICIILTVNRVCLTINTPSTVC